MAVGGHGGVDLYIDEKITPLGGARNVFALCFHEDALLEAGGRAGEGGKVQRWEWKSGRLVWSADDHDDVAYSIAVAGGKVSRAARTISVRELRRQAAPVYLTGHAGAVLALAASTGREGSRQREAIADPAVGRGEARALRASTTTGTRQRARVVPRRQAARERLERPHGACLAARR